MQRNIKGYNHIICIRFIHNIRLSEYTPFIKKNTHTVCVLKIRVSFHIPMYIFQYKQSLIYDESFLNSRKRRGNGKCKDSSSIHWNSVIYCEHDSGLDGWTKYFFLSFYKYIYVQRISLSLDTRGVCHYMKRTNVHPSYRSRKLVSRI